MGFDDQVLGYGGSALIGGVQVLVTGGSISTSASLSYLNALSIPPTSFSRARMRHASGTEQYTASLSFDMTDDLLALFTASGLLSRRSLIDIALFDGNNGQKLTDCYMTSLTLSGSPGGLINGSISLESALPPTEDDFITNAFIRKQEPMGYWYSGAEDVRTWTLTANQDVQPVYTNRASVAPKYLKVGLWDLSLDVETYDAVQAYGSISIKTKFFTLDGDSSSSGFSYNGPTDIGTFSHTFETAASITIGSQDSILGITGATPATGVTCPPTGPTGPTGP